MTSQSPLLTVHRPCVTGALSGKTDLRKMNKGNLKKRTQQFRLTCKSAASCGLARERIATAASVTTSGSAIATFVPTSAVAANPFGNRVAATVPQQKTPRRLDSAIQERVCEPAMGKLSVRSPHKGLMSQGISGRALYN